MIIFYYKFGLILKIMLYKQFCAKYTSPNFPCTQLNKIKFLYKSHMGKKYYTGQFKSFLCTN